MKCKCWSCCAGSIDGSDSSVRGVVGSLLDDNQWHDVEFLRQDKNVTVSVDRVPINITVHGEYSRLDLDRYVRISARVVVSLWCCCQWVHFLFVLKFGFVAICWRCEYILSKWYHCSKEFHWMCREFCMEWDSHDERQRSA